MVLTPNRRSRLKASVALAAMLAVAISPSGVAQVRTPATPASGSQAVGPLDVRVAKSEAFSRVEFRWSVPTRATISRDGQAILVRFNRNAKPDISRLRVSPPPYIKTAEAKAVGTGLEVRIELTDDADFISGQADGGSYINIFKRQDPEAKAAATQAAQLDPVSEVGADGAGANRPDPRPDNGIVPVSGKVESGQSVLRFPWKAPLGAAIFRRGDALWIVFDGKAQLDLSKVAKSLPQVRDLRAVQGDNYTALRLIVPQATPVNASAEGPVWAVGIGPSSVAASTLIKVGRDERGVPPSLTAAVAGATHIAWINDPVVGDRIGVVTALAPAKGLPSRRDYVEAAFLRSSQGLAIEPYVDDLEVSVTGDIVRIGRPKGLALSGKAAVKQIAAQSGAPQPAAMPALVDFKSWSETGSGGFLGRYHALMEAATDEATKNKDGDVTARMALARFLIGSDLSFEGIGMLNLVAKVNQTIMSNAEFRGLRGAAKVMAGRYKEASTDLASPVLQGDPSSALWRGYIAYKQGQWPEAREQFQQGMPAIRLFPPTWQARFARANAEATLAAGDVDGARTLLRGAQISGVDIVETLKTLLVQAQIFEAMGDAPRAMRMFDALALARTQEVSAPALLNATRIKLDRGMITPPTAAGIYDGLRYRWRGDANELKTIRTLGALYVSLGRYREALDVLRSAGNRQPDMPDSQAIQSQLSNAFKALFLDGDADGLEPIQALALFYDFKELTPMGADGDLMVRRLARRLVDVDLLDQAAELLKYQADERLDGVPRAVVATDLALINLMNRKPEQALAAINSSRTTVLPTSLNAERRIIEAKALVAVGRMDQALEILENDRSADASEVRGDVAWRQRAWPQVGPVFERSLGERWKATTTPLSDEDETRLLRAAIGYSLAGDDASLARLNQRFTPFVNGSKQADALRVALVGLDGDTTAADFAQKVSDNEIFAGWVDKMKQRFRDRAPPLTSRNARAAAPARPAA
jgi:tetratricopeptide (TPR) repeat protein